jgi:hypothetical protein
MPLINVGASCSTLPEVTPVSAGTETTNFYSVGSSSSKQFLGLDENDKLYVSDFSNSKNFLADLDIRDFNLFFYWDSNIPIPSVAFTYDTGVANINPGDFRLRYLISSKSSTHTYNENRQIVFLPDVESLNQFIIFGNGTNDASISVSTYKLTSPKLRKSVTSGDGILCIASTTGGQLPSVKLVQSDGTTSLVTYFIESAYVSDNTKPKNYLLADGSPYDVNQPLADTTKVVQLGLEYVKNVDTNLVEILIKGIPTSFQTVRSLSYSGGSLTGTITVNKKIYSPWSGTVSQDATSISGNNMFTIFNIVSSTPASVLGWQTDPSSSLIAKKNFYSFANTNQGTVNGFFNLIPHSSENSNFFMLLTSDNSNYLTLSDSAVTFNTTTSAMRSSTAVLSAYGAWSYENINNSQFNLIYYQPNKMDSGLFLGLDGTTYKGFATVTSQVLTLSCSYCSYANGTCVPGGSTTPPSSTAVVLKKYAPTSGTSYLLIKGITGNVITAYYSVISANITFTIDTSNNVTVLTTSPVVPTITYDGTKFTISGIDYT